MAFQGLAVEISGGGHCVIAKLEGCNGEFARAFAELAEAERLMHIWDVPT